MGQGPRRPARRRPGSRASFARAAAEGAREAATLAGDVHIFISHGRQDPTLPFVVSSWTRELFESAGARVAYHPHAGGHTVGDEATLRAIADWLRAAATRA